jgi:flagellar hook-associated protein 1
MGGLNIAFNTIQSALQAEQEAINVTANNVGNANTPGFTRETVTWQETDPVTIAGQQIGTGVDISGVTSQRNLILNQAIDQGEQALAQATSRAGGLTDVQDIFNQVATSSNAGGTGGIGSALTGFFSSLSTLETNPSISADRTGVLSAANTLAAAFNSAAGQLNQETNSLNLSVSSTVTQVNNLTSALASLNTQIAAADPNTDAGTLEDQRQQDISQLSQLIGINQTQSQNNTITLTTTNGTVLVEGSESFSLNAAPSKTQPGVTAIFSGNTDVTSGIQGGSLGGTLQNLYTDIPQVQSQIDTLAFSVATSVNMVQEKGVDENGNPTTTTPLFNITPTASGAAAAISVAITDPSQIAAASIGGGTSDGRNAESMANLENQTIVNGSTPTNFFASFTANLGSNLQSFQQQSSSLTTALTQLSTQQSSLSSVSQNEEAANLETFERAYQAASQTFTILNTLMGSALNMGVETAVS